MHLFFSLLMAQTTLQLDDGTLEQMWSLTSPNAGPADWIGAAYTPPYEFPFRVVSATMFYLDVSCCSGGSCSAGLCLSGADWERRVIAAADLAVDSAGLTPAVASAVSSQTNINFNGPGANFTTPPWTLTPDVWTLPAGTIFDHAGRVFYAIKYFDGDPYMRFAVDNGAPAADGFGIHTSDGFTTRASIWSFGNVGMRVRVEPIFFLKIGSVPPQPRFTLDSAGSLTMLSLRAGGGLSQTTVSRIRVTAGGSGNDALGVQAVRLVLDANRNGLADVGETTLASGSYATDNGFVDLTPNRSIAAGTTEEWVVVYDLTAQPSGGQTFSARIAAATDVDSNLGHPYVSGTTNGTGAIDGALLTIAGHLTVARGPQSPAARVVPAGATSLPALQVRVTTHDEAFSVTRLRLTAGGSANDVTELGNVRIWLDANGDGAAGGGDTQLAAGTFTQDDGSLDLSFAAVAIPADQSRDFLVTADISGSATGGDDFRVVLAAAADLGASGAASGPIPTSGPRALTGTPVIGDLQTVGGALTVALGAATPAAGTAQPGATGVPMLQVSLTAQAEAVALTSITLAGSGSGDEVADVARVRLYRDVNGNGLVDGPDVSVGLPQAFSTDNGIVTFAVTGESVPASASRLYLIAYDFTGAPTGGETFAARVSAASAVVASGQASGAPIVPSGTFPVAGATRTLLGGLSITLGPENPPSANVQPGAADVPVLALRVAAQGEAFTATALTVSAGGSVLDDTGVLRLELWRDAGTLGLRDAADTLIATAAYPADDGAALFTFNRPIAAGTNERWLVTYDLQLSVQAGQTFRATLAAGALAATGSLSGPATPTGLPLAGNTLAIGGTLTITAGPANPLGGSALPGTTGVVMMQARLTASLEPITVTGLTFTGAGSGNEMTAIAAARLFVDVDRDGELDAVGDLPLGAPRTFSQNDGTVTFTFPGRTIAAGANEDWVVVYDLGGAASAGQTFSVTFMNATDAVATAPSGALPRAIGAPLSGGLRTILGSLTVARGPTTPAAAQVRRDAAAVPLLQLRLTSLAEAFSVGSVSVSAAGSLDDVADLAGLTLILDANGDGLPGSTEPVLAGPSSFAADDGSVTFAGFAAMVPANASTDLLVVADLSGTAAGGVTLRLNLAAGGLSAAGLGGRPVVNAAAVGSDTLTVGGTVDVTLGVESPIARIVRPNETGVTALQLRLHASVEPATLTALTLHATGTGDDATAIANVAVFLDGDGNGQPGAGEPMLGSGSFSQDDGALSFTLSQPIQAGPALYLLAVVSMTASPLGGQTFTLELDPAANLSITSASNAVAVTGPALTGALLTAGGGFQVARGAQSNAGAAVNQQLQSVPVLQLDLTSVNEACTVQSIALRAVGSIDDRTDISAVRLLYDANDNGIVDFADVPLGSPATFLQDDGVVTFTGLSRTLGTNASERWLVAYDLSGSASNLETFGVRLEDDADLGVSCSVSGPLLPTGAPIESGSFTIQEDGALVITRGAQTPPSLFLPAGSVKSPVLQLRLAASVQDLTLDRLVLSATVSSGAPSDTLARISLFDDVNRDGLLDRTDRALGVGVPLDAGGRADLSGLSVPVHVADAIYLLAAVDVAAGATPGVRFSLGLAANADATAHAALDAAITTGAPAFGDPMTVAGHLDVAQGPSVPQTVNNDGTGLEALAFTFSALSETFRLRSVTITAEGTIDPADGIRGLSLVSGGRVIASDVRFAEGSSRTTFAGLDEPIAPGQDLALAVVIDLDGTARVDQSLSLSIAANVDVLAAGDDVGLTSPVGAPIVGGLITIGRSLQLNGGAALPDAIVAANATDVPALSFDMRASNEEVTVSRLSLRASGSLNDAVGVESVHLLLDRDGDGAIDPDDVEVARSARPAGDDGAITFSPLAEHLAKNTSARYLVTLDLSGSGAAGDEVTIALGSDADVTAFGGDSGSVAAAGAPIEGPRVTLVGALSIRLGDASPPGVGVTPGRTFAALQLEAFTQGEAVTVDQLALRLSGTADDGAAIRVAHLYRDLDDDGAVGDGDLVEADAAPDGDDGLLTFDGLGLTIGADRRLSLLFELELAEDAAAGGTLRLSLESNDRIRATGATSGAITAVGAPIGGSAFTIVTNDGGSGASPGGGCGCTASRPEDGRRGSALMLLLVGLAGGLRRGRWRRRAARSGEPCRA